MAKKKSEPTFGELVLAANRQIKELRAIHDDVRFVTRLIWHAFNSSFQIAVSQDYYQDFDAHLALVFASMTACKKLDLKAFWTPWPVKTTVFGMFSYNASSALELAAKFTENLYGNATIARVVEFTTFDSDPFKSAEMRRWYAAIRQELDAAHYRSLWPGPIMLRDYNVLRHQANSEVAHVLTGEKLGDTLTNAAPPEEPMITIKIILAIIKAKGSQIAGHVRTINEWSKNWESIDPKGARDRRFRWAEVRAWIKLHKRFDIEEPMDMT